MFELFIILLLIAGTIFGIVFWGTIILGVLMVIWAAIWHTLVFIWNRILDIAYLIAYVYYRIVDRKKDHSNE